MTAQEYLNIATTHTKAAENALAYLKSFLSSPEVKEYLNSGSLDRIAIKLIDELGNNYKYGAVISKLVNICNKTGIDILENEYAIPTYCFYDNKDLEEITIRKKVTIIGSSAFAGVKNLKRIVYEGTTEDWDNIEKVSPWYFNPSNDALLICKGDNKKWKLSFNGKREENRFTL